MGVNHLLHHKLFRSVIAVLLCACAGIQMLLAIEEQRIFIAKRTGSTERSLKDSKILTDLAEKKYLTEGDLHAASELIHEALTLSPYHVPALLLLAQIHYDTGRAEKANETLDYVDSITTDIKRYRWDKALVAYQFGRTEMVAEDISYIAREIGGKLGNKALHLAFSIWQEPEELLEILGPDALMVLFNYAARYPHLDKALYFWDLIESQGLEWHEDNLMLFIDMLFNMGRVQESADIWKKHFNPDQFIDDGTFLENFRRHAFTWRSNKHRSFKYSLEQGSTGKTNRTLHYRFTGWDNPEIEYIAQIIPLEGGREYTLIFDIKSDGLTTDKRPFMEVTGFNCNDHAPVRSEMVAPVQDWTTVRLSFDVPDRCSTVMLRFRREESLQIDNRLAGDTWLRSLEITPREKDYRVVKGHMQ